MENKRTEKVLTLHMDKAYRAKIENKIINENDFFYDVYKNAWRIVNDIIQDIQIFIEKESNTKYAARFAGLGNNIVFFSGGRGDGKTSAMRSFVKCLEGKVELGSENGEEQMSKNKFIVLDSIDPSAMESGENIVRILISRMYHMFEKNEERVNDVINYKKAKCELLEQFKKCYESIDSIKSDKTNDYDIDDLDRLSKLGSSAGLKEDIFQTVKNFLKIMNPKDNGNNRYMVVVIDDMDLAIKKIYRICEDIRNYLSVPNVIVLFAADYRQLLYAVYQKYLRSYRTLYKHQKDFDIEKECYSMAGRYLEKLFPIGHRIEMPKLENMIANRNTAIELRYCKYNEKKNGWFMEALQEKIAEKYSEIQEQLLRILYLKTGMVFLRKPGTLHYIFPRTLRELTHFTRMLDDMESFGEEGIDVSELFHNDAKRDSLLKNIVIFKQYFINYWCVNRLGIRQKELVEKIIEENENRNFDQISKVMNECCDSHEGDVCVFHIRTYWDICDNLEIVFLYEKEVGEALLAYYTIFLNEWYVVALGNCQEFEQIALFLKYPDERMNKKVFQPVLDDLSNYKQYAKNAANSKILKTERNVLTNGDVYKCLKVAVDREPDLVDKSVDEIRAKIEKAHSFRKNEPADENSNRKYDDDRNSSQCMYAYIGDGLFGFEDF